MISKLFLFLLIFASTCHAESFTLLSGENIQAISIWRIDPDGVVVTTANGNMKLKFTNLPEEVRARFNYDPKKEATYLAYLTREEKVNAERKVRSEQWKAMQKYTKYHTLVIEITQILPDGIIGNDTSGVSVDNLLISGMSGVHLGEKIQSFGSFGSRFSCTNSIGHTISGWKWLPVLPSEMNLELFELREQQKKYLNAPSNTLPTGHDH